MKMRYAILDIQEISARNQYKLKTRLELDFAQYRALYSELYPRDPQATYTTTPSKVNTLSFCTVYTVHLIHLVITH